MPNLDGRLQDGTRRCGAGAAQRLQCDHAAIRAEHREMNFELVAVRGAARTLPLRHLVRYEGEGEGWEALKGAVRIWQVPTWTTSSMNATVWKLLTRALIENPS